MAHRELQEDTTKNPVEEITEEQFLKNLYLFMKKRDTPIEKIPNLGFKQIDLFVMFKTVNDLGGYHQVTSHQLWKQIYNTLGGNPRSTSAATCTRRHYEKLLLPYECHLKGIMIGSVPQQHQPKPYRYSRDDDGGQRPSKRRLLSLQMHQGSHNYQSDPCGSLYPQHLHYPHYYHPNDQVLPPYAPMPHSGLTPHDSTVIKPQFPFQQSRPDSTDTVKEPLQQLRDLSEHYKFKTGLVEPLNLSVKASSRESNSNPVSSFSPPSSSKNPKFLNKPSSLYTPHHAGVLRNEGCEAQDGESSGEATASSCPVKAQEGHGLNTKALKPSDSPVYGPALTLEVDKNVSEMTQKPSSPKEDFATRPAGDRKAISELGGLGLSHILQSLPRQKDGKMEIEVPLSVLHNWLKLYQFPAAMHEVKELPDHEEPSVQTRRSDLDNLPYNLTFQLNPQQQSTSNKSPLSGGILKNASSQNLWSFEQQDTDKSYLTAKDLQDANKNESLAFPDLENCDSGPLKPQQDFASKFYGENTVHGETQKTRIVPSSLLKLNSNSATVLHFTNEEIIKLKKIISSSSLESDDTKTPTSH
ncbi:AT-rich interaction domain 6 [Melanotaenia boesemani]|uniref:AT-rich interaction domain 6 n=1 Tax=Melanotaenia boesemani TaxID=1250792 RepID=UPI001C04407E|nr:AT-rich interaction domain 6 [Melanotaenia boesemani]